MTGPIYLWDIYLKTIKLSTKYIKMHVREIIDISYFIQLPTTRFYTSLRSTSADLELKKKNNDFSTDMTIIWQPCKIMMHIFFIFFHGNFVTILGKPGQKSVYWPRDKTTDDRVSSPAPPRAIIVRCCNRNTIGRPSCESDRRKRNIRSVERHSTPVHALLCIHWETIESLKRLIVTTRTVLPRD